MKTIDANAYNDASSIRVKQHDDGHIELHHGYPWAGDVKMGWEELFSHWNDVPDINKASIARLLHHLGCPLSKIPEYRREYYRINAIARTVYACGCIDYTESINDDEFFDTIPKNFNHSGDRYDWHDIIHYGKKLIHKKMDCVCGDCEMNNQKKTAQIEHDEKMKNAIISTTALLHGYREL